jgi:hypothetical protein
MLLGTDTERRDVPADDATGPAPVLPLVAPSATDAATCACGHQREAHEHYRRGSDCALCDCPRFRRRR